MGVATVVATAVVMVVAMAVAMAVTEVHLQITALRPGAPRPVHGPAHGTSAFASIDRSRSNSTSSDFGLQVASLTSQGKCGWQVVEPPSQGTGGTRDSI